MELLAAVVEVVATAIRLTLEVWATIIGIVFIVILAGIIFMLPILAALGLYCWLLWLLGHPL